MTTTRGQGGRAGTSPAAAPRDDRPEGYSPRPSGRPRRTLRAAVSAAVVVALLGAASYAFVLLSIPYRTPQQLPPRVRLTSQEVASFRTYPRALREVPVLTWRDVSRRIGHMVVSPQHFATQLAALRRAGFSSVRPAVLAALAAGHQVRLPPRPVVLTFDSGLATDWTAVDPILQRYGFSAVVFVDPANIAVKSPSYFLTRDELHAMAVSGRWEVGVQLAPRWRSATAIARAAWVARGQVHTVTGMPVTAYAWPVLDVPSTSSWQAPAALHSALRWDFAEVFDRPAAGPATFVVARMGGPLPRMEITKTDTLSSLSLRLRTGVEAPPPADLLTLPWLSVGGKCHASARAVTLTARHYALCTVVANGARWRNYGLRFGIQARAGTSAIIELRLGADSSCLEIAIGQSELSIKQRTGSRWRELRHVSAQPAGIAGLAGPRPALVGAGRLPATVSVTGSMLTVTAGQLAIHQRVSGKVSHGIIALGMVSPGGKRSLTYHRPVVFTTSRR